MSITKNVGPFYFVSALGETMLVFNGKYLVQTHLCALTLVQQVGKRSGGVDMKTVLVEISLVLEYIYVYQLLENIWFKLTSVFW